MNAHPRWVCRSLFFIAGCVGILQVNGQSWHQPDTLVLKLPQARQLLVSKNLVMLANHFSIDINKAFALQSKYWDNPILFTDQNLYDGKFFNHEGDNGQFYFQVQQIIKTAGKRRKLVQLSNDNVFTSEQQYRDLLRNLDYVLTTDFNEVAQLQSILQVYAKEASSLQQLAGAMETQYRTGNISAREKLRVQGLLFVTNSEKTEIEKQISDLQKELHTMLNVDSGIVIKADLEKEDSVLQFNPTLQALLDTARRNRPDLEIARIQTASQEHNVSYQKSLRSPDLNVGVEYDKANSYVPNYWGFTVALPLPILNRNKGNIKAAELSVEQANLLEKQSVIRAEEEVIAAFQKFETIVAAWKHSPPQLQEQYDLMLVNMTRSYQQHQIGLLEFIDFFESYKQIMINRLQQRTNLLNAAAELNLTTGHHII